MVEILRDRPALGELFWSNVFCDSSDTSPMYSLLLGTRYPLQLEQLPRLLAAAASSSPTVDVNNDASKSSALMGEIGPPSNARRAWAFARALRFGCNQMPMQLNELRMLEGDRLCTEAQGRFGSPPLYLAAHTEGARVGDTVGESIIVEWHLPRSHPLDALPFLHEAVGALLSSGLTVSSATQRAAYAALSLFAQVGRELTEYEGTATQLPDLAQLVALLPLCAQLSRPPASAPTRMVSPAPTDSAPTLLELVLELLSVIAPLRPKQLCAALQGSPLLNRCPSHNFPTTLPNCPRHALPRISRSSNVLCSLPSHHRREFCAAVPRETVCSTTVATLDLLLALVSGVASCGGLEGELPSLPAALVPAALYVVQHALPLVSSSQSIRGATMPATTNLDERSSSSDQPAAERGVLLRAFALLTAILDLDGAAAAVGAVGAGSAPRAPLSAAVVPLLLCEESAAMAIMMGLAEIRLVYRAREASAARQHPKQTTGRLENSSPDKLLTVTLALLLRLLQVAHTGAQGCTLHAALLSSASSAMPSKRASDLPRGGSAIRDLGLCVMLHHDVALQHQRHRQDRVDTASTWAVVSATEILDRKSDWRTTGPLAMRALALLCHAAPLAIKGTSQLQLALTPLSASISSILEAWLVTPTHKDSFADALAEGGGHFDCASAALQLLGAAAESQPELFRRLCRGGLRKGDWVRVRAEVSDPGDGWGGANATTVGQLDEMREEGVLIDFASVVGLWKASSVSSIELCPPRQGEWLSWDKLKAKPPGEGMGKGVVAGAVDGMTTPKRPLDPAVTSDKEGRGGQPWDGGALVALQLLVEQWPAQEETVAMADPVSEAAGQLRKYETLALCVQALATLRTLWKQPSVHASTLRVARARTEFWRALPALVSAPLTLQGAVSDEVSEELRHAWLSSSLSLELLTIELRRSTPPRALLPAVQTALGAALEHITRLPQLVLRGAQAHGLPGRVAEVALLTRKLHCGFVPVYPQPPIECSRLSGALRRQLVERSLLREERIPSRLLAATWAGAARAYLTLEHPLYDLEMLTLRSALLDDAFVQRSKRAAAQRASSSAAAEAGALAALAAVEVRALAGDESAADEAADLLERLPYSLAQETPRPSSLLNLDESRPVANRMKVLQAATKANEAVLSSAAHSVLVRSWQGLLAALLAQGHIARPSPALDASDAADASAPPWLRDVSEANPLEPHLERRIKDLAKEQKSWTARCVAAKELRAHAETAGAACELLRQQALALCGAPSLAWELVERLLVEPEWQASLLEGKLQRTADGALPSATDVAIQNYPVAAPTAVVDDPAVAALAVRTTGSQRDARLLVLQTTLENKSKSLHRSDRKPGWQLLYRLTDSMCVRLEAARKATGNAAPPPDASATLKHAITALRENDKQLRQLADTTAPCDPPDAQQLPRSTLEQLPANLTTVALQHNEAAARLVGLPAAGSGSAYERLVSAMISSPREQLQVATSAHQ